MLAMMISACSSSALTNNAVPANSAQSNQANTTAVKNADSAKASNTTAADSKSAASSLDSVYSDIKPGDCKTISVEKETGASVQKCSGIEGYDLLVEDDDLRQSITVLSPDGKRHPLNYWEVITTNFSSIGDKAEWRVEKDGGKVRPVALIVRVNANENPNSPSDKTSYLAVAKITTGNICVTDKIKGGASGNEDARKAADASANKPCLK